ncbi:MAG: DUF6641 family protein [Alphaproteobacteria bacterium]
MSALAKLKLSTKTRPQSLTSPEARVRQKLLDAILDQIAVAEADQRGEQFIKRGMRFVQDPETGERVKREVPVRLRRWWFRDENGQLFLEVRYGNKRVPIRQGKTAIEVGSADNLVPALELLREAVSSGELDKPLMEIRDERAARFSARGVKKPSK